MRTLAVDEYMRRREHTHIDQSHGRPSVYDGSDRLARRPFPTTEPTWLEPETKARPVNYQRCWLHGCDGFTGRHATFCYEHMNPMHADRRTQRLLGSASMLAEARKTGLRIVQVIIEAPK